MPVYSDPAFPSNDSFWLFLITNTTSRSIEGIYLEKNDAGQYKLGGKQSLTWNCVVRKNKSQKDFYVVTMNQEGEFYRLPSPGVQFLTIQTT